jgi:dTDP-4-dehydrorhamnose 3,5-epimerase
MNLPEVILGSIYEDGRGKLISVNGVLIEGVCRFYLVQPCDTNIIRAWQGHIKEQKWFFPLLGKFLVKVLSMDENGQVIEPNKKEEYQLDASKPILLNVPAQYYNGFQALETDSLLLVLSDASLDESKKDDFRMTLTEFPW